MTTLEILKVARELISDRSHWTQGEYARDAKELPVNPNDESATCFCAVGAIAAVQNKRVWLDGKRSAVDALGIGAKAIDQHITIVEVNDRMGHDATLKMFDIAIQKVQEKWPLND